MRDTGVPFFFDTIVLNPRMLDYDTKDYVKVKKSYIKKKINTHKQYERKAEKYISLKKWESSTNTFIDLDAFWAFTPTSECSAILCFFLYKF